MESIKGYADKQFITYFVAIKKNFVDVNNPKMVETRAQLQDSVCIRDSVIQAEQQYSHDQAIEKIKVD